jgi:hypothetical protein
MPVAACVPNGCNVQNPEYLVSPTGARPPQWRAGSGCGARPAPLRALRLRSGWLAGVRLCCCPRLRSRRPASVLGGGALGSLRRARAGLFRGSPRLPFGALLWVAAPHTARLVFFCLF